MELPWKKVHMVGIGGIGMSALAQLLADAGVQVGGSDRAESPVTELLQQKGIAVVTPQQADNVPADADVIIYTEAVDADNPERVRAAELAIPQMSYFTALGVVSAGKRTLAVAGTHGKTTTTGMAARILADAGIAPTAIVGSIMRDFGSNYLSGTSDWFVVEACEYRRDFLTLTPEVLVITNIELDHTDYYTDLADIQAAFRAFAEKVPAHGAIITNPHDPVIAPVIAGLAPCIIDYTQEPLSETRFPGVHNAQNAQAAVAASRVVVPAIADDALRASLLAFAGTWRRFEHKGVTPEGAEVYDDYAHHPTAVAKTVAALRERTKGRVFVAFEPHLFSRTRDLFNEFVAALAGADRVFIAPIYAAREPDDGTVSHETLAAALQAQGTTATAGTFAAIHDALRAEAGPDDVVMTMGAGTIYTVADRLVSH